MQACKRPKPLYEQSERIDWRLPGSHVVAKKYDVEYYRAELFSQAVTFGKYIPVFINDMKSQFNFKRHYIDLWGQLDDLIMINNWPINKFAIVGKVTGESHFDKRDYSGARIQIDDSSGKDLNVEVLISLEQYEAIFPEPGVNYGKLVEVRGVFKNWKPVVEDIVVVSPTPNDLTSEILHWNIRVQFRKTVLAKAWKFDATAAQGDDVPKRESVFYNVAKNVAPQKSMEPITETPRRDVGSVTNFTGTSPGTQVGTIHGEAGASTNDTKFVKISGVSDNLETILQALLDNKYRYIKLVKESLIAIIKRLFNEITLDELVSDRFVLNQINVFAEVLQRACGYLDITYRQEIIFRLALYFRDSELFEFTDNVIKPLKFQLMYYSIQRKLSTRTQIKTLKYVDYLTKKLQISNCDYKLVNFLIRYIVLTSDLHWRYIKDEIKWVKS